MINFGALKIDFAYRDKCCYPVQFSMCWNIRKSIELDGTVLSYVFC